MTTYRILTGDCRATLATLPDASVQCCVTSPPYWGLRDYGIAEQIGLESTPEAYVAELVAVFREVRRVLANDGVLWLNLGDSYSGSGKGGNPDEGKQATNKGIGVLYGKTGETARESALTNVSRRWTAENGIQPKNLIGIPWRVAFALQQPYAVPTCVATERDRAWLAAMFDGEGCIGIRRFDSYRAEKQQTYQDGFVAYTVVTNNDTVLLDRCAELTGFGKCALKQRAGTQDKRGVVSRRDSFGWRLDGNKAINVVCAVYPYLLAKRKQACIVYTLDRLNKNGHGSRAVPADVQGKKQHLWELVKRCNQRETVDLPSWIEEPKEIIEPGWYLRSDVIWAKPNPMPESVTDRPTKSHEYVFLLSKSERYFYDTAAIAEPYAEATVVRGKSIRQVSSDGTVTTRGNGEPLDKDTRNARTVWLIATQPYRDAHFAVMPEALATRCILAGSSIGDTVLDPFAGAGTTGVAALGNGRSFIGCEANPAYVAMAQRRLAGVAPLFSTEVPA